MEYRTWLCWKGPICTVLLLFLSPTVSSASLQSIFIKFRQKQRVSFCIPRQQTRFQKRIQFSADFQEKFPSKMFFASSSVYSDFYFRFSVSGNCLEFAQWVELLKQVNSMPFSMFVWVIFFLFIQSWAAKFNKKCVGLYCLIWGHLLHLIER